MDDTSLANAIVDLFKNFYTVYLTDFNWKKYEYSPFPGTIINYENGMGEICDYYNNIAGVLDKTNYSNTELKAYPIKLQGDGIKEFQNELNALSSDDLRLFLWNLLDFIKAYKLYALKDILKYIEDIGDAFKKIEEKFNNAEKHLADLIIAVGKGKDSIVTKLKELKSDYEKGTFFKNEKGLNLIVKTVKELGVTEEYGEVMKEIDIGLYYKKMSFDNSELVTNGTFSSWKLLKQEIKKYIDIECEKCNIIIGNNSFDKLEKAIKHINKHRGCKINWNNKIFSSYKRLEIELLQAAFSNLKNAKKIKISKNDEKLIKELYLMDSPHAHHVLYKGWENNRIWRWKNESEEDFEKRKSKFNANKEANKDLDEKIRKARKVLWEYDIDPYVGLENLCWAPNVNPDQHNDEHIRIIAEALISFYNENAPREKIVEYLENMKNVAKDLWKNYNKGEK